MRIDFNEIASMTFPGMDNGTGMMSARMYNDDSYRIIPTAIHPGGSIGNHKQNSGDDMNYILSGTGKAFCDGVEEDLKPGVMHICPQGSEHSIVNTGEEDLVMLTIECSDPRGQMCITPGFRSSSTPSQNALPVPLSI